MLNQPIGNHVSPLTPPSRSNGGRASKKGVKLAYYLSERFGVINQPIANHVQRMFLCDFTFDLLVES